jgi:putative FmdB family regulatory protein
MPIYEYRCSACGFQKEFLQKVSAEPLHTCPECGKESFNKLLSAAGFQLKGSGWYATDFKNSNKTKTAAKEDGSAKKDDSAAKKDDTTASGTCSAGPCPSCQ